MTYISRLVLARSALGVVLALGVAGCDLSFDSTTPTTPGTKDSVPLSLPAGEYQPADMRVEIEKAFVAYRSTHPDRRTSDGKIVTVSDGKGNFRLRIDLTYQQKQ